MLIFASSSSIDDILGFGVVFFEWMRDTDFADFSVVYLVSLVKIALVVVLRGRV